MKDWISICWWTATISICCVNALSPAIFLEDLWIWKDNFPFLDPRMKEVKGIQKKGQERNALIKPWLSVNNLKLEGKISYEIFWRDDIVSKTWQCMDQQNKLSWWTLCVDSIDVYKQIGTGYIRTALRNMPKCEPLSSSNTREKPLHNSEN